MARPSPPHGQRPLAGGIDRGLAHGSLFHRSAYRLELLDWYTSQAIERRLTRFLAGEKIAAEERASWRATTGNAKAAGATMSRVHVVAEPVSDYLPNEFNCYESSASDTCRTCAMKSTCGKGCPAALISRGKQIGPCPP